MSARCANTAQLFIDQYGSVKILEKNSDGLIIIFSSIKDTIIEAERMHRVFE